MLQKIAYRIVGCIADAEDIVQDAFLGFLKKGPEKIENVKAYLMSAVVNTSLNHLKAARNNLTDFIESSPENRFKINAGEENISDLDKNREIDLALKVIHEKLEPIERLIFVLREIFDFDYETLQEIIQKNKDNCRQIFSRARAKLSIEDINFSSPYKGAASGLIEGFKNACNFGKMSELIHELMNGISVRLK